LRRPCVILFIVLCSLGIPPVLASDTVSFLVFPPDNLTGNPALAWVGEAIALSISGQLTVPGVSAFSREDRVGFVESADLPPNSPLSRASMIHIAQQVSADRLVTGSFTGTEDRLQIVLKVLGLKPVKVPFGGETAVGGPIGSLPQMENELAWMLLANAGLNKSQSREQFRERARTIPNGAFALFIQSLTQNDADERIRLLNRAVALYPPYPEAHARLGQYYFEEGDCAKSIPHLEMPGASQENHLENQFRLGTCRLKQGDFQGAVRSFSAILAFIQSSQVLNNLGVAYLRKGDYTLAAESFIEARTRLPAEPTILTNLAIVRHLQGDDAAARSLLDDASKSIPSRGITQFVLGIILALQGEQEKSVLALAQAKRLGTDPEKLSAEDPKSWAQPFTTWSGKP
jgi:Tfp pilus assembly protein PilF